MEFRKVYVLMILGFLLLGNINFVLAEEENVMDYGSQIFFGLGLYPGYGEGVSLNEGIEIIENPGFVKISFVEKKKIFLNL